MLLHSDINGTNEAHVHAQALKKKKKGPKVVAPLVDATRSGQPITKEQQLETNIVFFLFCLFTLILVLGLLLAGSVRCRHHRVAVVIPIRFRAF